MEQDKYRQLWSAIQEAANRRDMGELMDACADYFDVDAQHESHGGVVGLLESCRESCRTAAMEYGMSFK